MNECDMCATRALCHIQYVPMLINIATDVREKKNIVVELPELHSFVSTKHFFVLRIMKDPEPVLGTR